MSKIIISLVFLIIPLFGGKNFTDKDMKKYSELILNNKQNVFTVSELVRNLFLIQEKGEFETQEKYKKRISDILGSGVFFVYKKLYAKYNIDKKEIEFGDINIGSYGTILNQMLDAENPIKEKGFSQVDYRLSNKIDKPFPLKDMLVNDKERLAFNSNGNYAAFIRMPVEEAKKLKNSEENTFFQIIAVKIDEKSIQSRKIEDISFRYNGTMLYRLAFDVNCEIIGTSVIAVNPKHVFFTYGISK